MSTIVKFYPDLLLEEDVYQNILEMFDLFSHNIRPSIQQSSMILEDKNVMLDKYLYSLHLKSFESINVFVNILLKNAKNIRSKCYTYRALNRILDEENEKISVGQNWADLALMYEDLVINNEELN